MPQRFGSQRNLGAPNTAQRAGWRRAKPCDHWSRNAWRPQSFALCQPRRGAPFSGLGIPRPVANRNR
jgi:hypothetical protein